MIESEVLVLARSLRRMGAIMNLGEATGFDPQRTLIDAWMYQLAVGWDCEGGRCEAPDDPAHMCTGALDELADHNGWPDWFVGQLRAARRGARLLLAEVDAADAARIHRVWPGLSE